MNGALLLRPRQRWHIGIAFAFAVLIHCGAVGLAGIRPGKQIEDAPIDGPTTITLDPPEPTADPVQPPDTVDPLPLPNPPDDFIPEERPQPQPVRKQNVRPSTPIQRENRSLAAGWTNLSTAKVLALSAPRPEYPYEARRQRITGDGIVIMAIDPATGTVTEVSMWKSTGNPILDNATTSAFRRWRFKPGTISRVRVPVTFTMMGASY